MHDCMQCRINNSSKCSNCYGRPVARFQDLVGHNTFLGGHDFCFYYMFKTNFSGRNKIWGEQRNLGGHGPRIPPRGYGPVVRAPRFWGPRGLL